MPAPDLLTELQRPRYFATTGQYGVVILAPDGSPMAGAVVQATDSRLKKPERYTYADLAARNAASGFVADDIGKWALQLDTASYYRLSNHLPITWQGPYGPNSPDAFLLDRANHTGTQAWTTITATPTTIVGYGITDAVSTTDPRMTDARTPTAHAATHASGGTDALTPAAIGAAAAGHTHTATATDRSYGWQEGTLAVGTHKGPHYRVTSNLTVQACHIYATTPPGTSAAEIDIQYLRAGVWASIFTTRPTVAAGANIGGTDAVLAVTALNAGDWLRMDVVAAGGTPAADVTVQLDAMTR